MIKQLVDSVEKFYTFRPKRIEFQHSPLHIFAEQDLHSLYATFFKGAKNKSRMNIVLIVSISVQKGPVVKW